MIYSMNRRWQVLLIVKAWWAFGRSLSCLGCSMELFESYICGFDNKLIKSVLEQLCQKPIIEKNCLWLPW